MSFLFNKKYLPLIATILVFLAIFLIGGMNYKNFLSTRVLGNVLADNSFIIIAAVGATFVILSGGIDLSIGSMIGFVGVSMAVLDSMGWNPLASALLMLAFGILFGMFQGYMIDTLNIQPFIITLAGLFLLRGACFMVTVDSVPIDHEWASAYSSFKIHLPGKGLLRSSAMVMLVSLVVGIFIAHFTRFGTAVYALGGDKESARLMGVNIRRTTVGVYALGGFYSALAGVVYALYTKSGYPLAGSTLELSAIASVVLGGTLLTGGVGMVAGTLFGGMILGLISTLIIFNGSLNSAWILISSGALLFAFIVLHRFLVSSFNLKEGS
ncbi:MAG: sugar ABC transporter permease YjfF [Maritimibacter sp.]|jgi:galactofuranose transport system permease protein